MSTDLPPPPPPATPPPPPPGAPQTREPAAPPTQEEKQDNGIAIAGLIVGLLATILSIIVIGGVLALVGLALSIIGLRRSAELDKGRGPAIGGIILSCFAFFVAIASFMVLLAEFNNPEDTVVGGIATSSDNTEFPPQSDLDTVECTSSDSGASALAVVTITNRSGGQSNYLITVAWDGPAGEVTDTIRSEFLPADDSQTMRLFAPDGVEPQSCRVTRIERSGFGFFRE